ncbi:MAG: glycoside hydrolase family 3 C-terminal domain-containing protein [Clostridia bacterium]|nr:glycoside hydrolase family 3 C-terminal domain-containing protein [Clostridia bacterium]
MPEIGRRAAAVIEAWYPGERGGEALSRLIAGRENFSGRLPATFPVSADDLPPFDDYEMAHGRTYLYAKKPPLWPFGFGLSYTRFAYADPRAVRTPDGWDVAVTVKNTGERAGDEVIELYLDSAGLPDQPIFRLRGFRRVTLGAGEERRCVFRLTEEDFTLYEGDGGAAYRPGRYTAYFGGSLPDRRSLELGAAECVSVVIEAE